ncbi:amino acid permease, partial [Bacillus sp. D-CC]
MEFWFSLIKVIAILSLIGTGLWMCLTHFVSPNGVVASYGHIFEKDAFIPHGWVGFLAGFQ